MVKKKTAGLQNLNLGFRAKETTVEHQLIGSVTLRDQHPMRPKILGLRKCLVGMEVQDWYGLVDNHIFFCLSPHTIENFKSKYDRQVVLKFQTCELIEGNEEAAYLTPINSGAVEPAYAPRGAQTFHMFNQWCKSGFTDRVRKTQPKPVELAFRISCLKVPYEVCD